MEEWSKEMCFELIDLYENYPVLWDSNNNFYYSKNKKREAWLEIGKQLNMDARAVKQKMCSLLGSFRSQKSKGKKFIGNGKDGKDVYVSKWFAFERMHFLLDKDEPRNTNDTEINEETNSEPSESQFETPAYFTEENAESFIEENESKFEIVTDNLDHDNLEEADEQMKPVLVAEPPPKKVRKRTQPMGDPRTQGAYKVPRDAHTQQQSLEVPDRFTTYGQHVANKLRLYNPRTEALVEHLINNILFQADLGIYDGNTHEFYSNQNKSYPSHVSTPSSTHSSR